MHYKTIVLQILEDRPQLRINLQQQHQMLVVVEECALELKYCHQSWQKQLRQANPASDPAQIASEAMELALADLIERLPAESELTQEAFCLDAIMARLKRPSSDV